MDSLPAMMDCNKATSSVPLTLTAAGFAKIGKSKTNKQKIDLLAFKENIRIKIKNGDT